MIERRLTPLLGTLAAIHLALFAVFVGTLVSVTPADARGTTCTGRNLATVIAERNPEAMNRILARAGETPNGQGVLWRVERDGAVSHLFGTAHVTDPRITELSPTVERLVDGASAVVLEIAELADPEAMQAAAIPAMPKMLYMDGTTLDEHLSEADLAALRERTESPDMPWQVTRIMRPWTAMAALSVPVCERAAQKGGLPVLDQVLARRAAAAGIPVIGLETVVEQADFMAGMPEPLMVQSLQDVIRMGSAIDDVFETTLALYDSGDTALLWALMREPALVDVLGLTATEEETAKRKRGYAAFQAKLLDERNRNMAERMQPHLEKGGAFVAVGALHLPGKEGVVELLRQRGWTVTRV